MTADDPEVVRIAPPPQMRFGGAAIDYHVASGIPLLAQLRCANPDCASRAKRRGRWRPGRLLALRLVGTTRRRCPRCGMETTFRPVALRPASDESEPALA